MPPRVLFVDDEDCGLSMAAALEGRAIVDLAADSETAFRMSSRTHYDFMVIDHHLGEKCETGTEFLVRVRNRAGQYATESQVRVIAMTGETDPRTRRRYQELGAIFLSKPCSSVTLAYCFDNFDSERARINARWQNLEQAAREAEERQEREGTK